jgi:tetratricopeptide (TPR) repeat protein
MTKQDFIHYLSHPEELNDNSIPLLKKIVKQYPYFQTARLLYLKNLHNEDSIEYEKCLNITSAYAPTGKVLYNLIKIKPNRNKNHKKENFFTENQTIIPTNISQETPLQEEAIIVLEEMKVMPDQGKKKNEYNELHILEKKVLEEHNKTLLDIELQKDVPSSKDENKKVEPIDERQKPHSFTDWLKIVSGKSLYDSDEEESLHKKQSSKIIDKFILEETSKPAVKPKVEFYSAEAMAKKSITDDETFVTETLASIYFKQGNHSKALRAYEILMIKYPEKIHIFAPILEKIKNFLKEQKHK